MDMQKLSKQDTQSMQFIGEAFDSVPHVKLLTKLESHDIALQEMFLHSLKVCYLAGN